MSAVRWCRWTAVVAAAMAFASSSGCSSDAPRQAPDRPAFNNLQALCAGYIRATTALQRPPKNSDELRPFLAKIVDNPDQLLKSTVDGSDLVIYWGADLRTMKPQDGQLPIWAYEQNSHRGKRWVLQERRPKELTDEEFRRAPMAAAKAPA